MSAPASAWARISSSPHAPAHIARRSGEGWLTHCGSWTAFEPLPAPDTARHCRRCTSVEQGAGGAPHWPNFRFGARAEAPRG